MPRRRTMSSVRRSSPACARPELLEERRLLSVAPVAADDWFELGADNRLAVDVSTSAGPAGFDLSPVAPAGPAGPFTTTDFERIVGPGEQMSEPAWVEGGQTADADADVSVRGAAARWSVADWAQMAFRGKATLDIADGGVATFNNWFDLGAHGVGDMTVSSGGVVNAHNFAQIGGAETGSGGGGAATLTVTGATSHWNNYNWLSVGYGRSSGTLRLLDHATMVLGNSSDPTQRGSLSVGENEGFGLMEVADGASFRQGDFATIGDNRGRGELRITGGATVGTGNWAAIGDNGALGTVTVSGAGSKWTVGNHFTVGDNGGRGVLNVSDGGIVSTSNWVEIGRDNGSDGRVIVGDGGTFSFKEFLAIGDGPGGNRGTLFVGAGGLVTNNGGQGFGDGPVVINFPAGRILGSGTINGQVQNVGFLSPGGSIGLLTINGDLIQPGAGTDPFRIPATGVTQFDIGGTQRGTQYDAIDVRGDADFEDGKVVLNFVNGFAPKLGDRFTLVDASSLDSVPRHVEVHGLAPGFTYTLARDDDRLVLTALNNATSAPVTAATGKGVLANDTDADGDALAALLVKRPEHGMLTLSRDGSFNYVPDESFTGTDSFTYLADDGVFTSEPATVTIRDLAPVAHDDAYATDQGAPLTVAAADGVLKNDTDTVSTSLTASLLAAPAHGTVALQADGAFTYTPAAGFAGTDTFTYRASDGLVQSAPAAVTITVRHVNANPITVADNKTVRQDQVLTFPAADLLANDSDPDGDTLAVTGVSATADTHGTVSISQGTVTYRPDAHYAGPAAFTYAISDGHGGTATGTVNVTVQPADRRTLGIAVGAGTVGMGRRMFQFAVLAGRGDGAPIRGVVSYRDVSNHVMLRSDGIDRFVISADGKAVTIGGSAVVNGRSGYRFELVADDVSGSGRNDRFRIRVTGPNLFAYDSAGGRADGERLDRGNILILGSIFAAARGE